MPDFRRPSPDFQEPSPDTRELVIEPPPITYCPRRSAPPFREPSPDIQYYINWPPKAIGGFRESLPDFRRPPPDDLPPFTFHLLPSDHFVPLDSFFQAFVEVCFCFESEQFFCFCCIKTSSRLTVGFGVIPANLALKACKLDNFFS